MIVNRKSGRRRTGSPRNPQRTRERLLQAAFQQVHRSGFQGTDLETILDTAGVTKGALYHHFENKEALGYAIVDEAIAGIMREKWLQPLQNTQNPIDAWVGVMQSHRAVGREELELGCALNNLSQEMSPLDEGFRKRLARVFREWHDGTAAAFREGQKRGVVRSDVDPDETATFLIAAYEGCWSLAKNAQDARVLQSGLKSIIRYLDSLRAPNGRSQAAGSG